MDNGAQRALIPIENKRSFFDVSADVLENMDPIIYIFITSIMRPFSIAA
jgi:ATP-dependent Lon protease